jgi:hypothetical protein
VPRVCIAGTQNNFTRNTIVQTPLQTNTHHVSGKKMSPIVIARDTINWAVSSSMDCTVLIVLNFTSVSLLL